MNYSHLFFYSLTNKKVDNDNNQDYLSDSGDSLDEDIDFNQITFDEVDGTHAQIPKKSKRINLFFWFVDHLLAFQEDEIVSQALENEMDLREYAKQVAQEKISVQRDLENNCKVSNILKR